MVCVCVRMCKIPEDHVKVDCMKMPPCVNNAFTASMHDINIVQANSPWLNKMVINSRFEALLWVR